MKERELEGILDECIDRMNRGESIEDCLASYPEHAEELRPLLTASAGLRETGSAMPGRQARAEARRRFYTALADKKEEVSMLKRLFETLSVQRTKALATVSIVLLVALAGLGINAMVTSEATPPTGISPTGGEIAAFQSEAALVAYLQESSELYASDYYGRGGGGFLDIQFSTAAEEGGSVPAPSADKSSVDRVSGTNVQVIGIDEPDIVKTDGTNIYFSRSDYWVYSGIDIRVAEEGNETWTTEVGNETWPSVEDESGIYIIGAFPPVNMSVIGEIDLSGDLLLYGNTLMVFTWDSIVAYDVTDPQNPAQKWQIDIEDSTSTVAARLYDGKVYLVTQTWLDTYDPLPIVPLKVDNVSVEIGYSDVYYPIVPVPADATYNAMVINPDTGAVEGTMSFIGSAYTSVVYMSPSAIYITYTYQENVVPMEFDFCINYCQGLLPDTTIARIQTLQGYDISDAAKLTEIQVIVGDWLNTLSGDQRTIADNDLTNRLADYYDQHIRDLERTGIIKINLVGFTTLATGSVPGSVLNQFSLDEYNGYLRIATTVGNMWGSTFLGRWIDSASANDVYVLDGSLSTVGSIQGLGLTEQIYAVRFIGDKGYVVTFRQTDPFYVLDLSDPLNPQLRGELKIPGYSSYLHPISDNIILGIGQEDWQVKLSLFDVTDPANPVELDNYTMAEYWTDVSSTHHAFLLDDMHQVFFLPAGESGYVFSYAGNQMTLVKSVSDIQAKRALYINDYLYIVGDSKLVVLNELDWTTVSELEL